jgi:Xaa-Pro aminopeptidase
MLLFMFWPRSGFVCRAAVFRTAIISLLIFQATLYAGEDQSFFADRRNALMKKIEGSIAVLQGAPSPRAYTSFRQDNNFYYLTGVEIPNALLILDGSRQSSILFLPLQSEKAKQWEGPHLGPGPDACRETGIDEVLEVSQFQKELEKRLRDSGVVYTPLSPYEVAATSRDRAMVHDRIRQNDSWDGRISREAAFKDKLRESLGKSFRVMDLSPILDEMRRVKDSQEIDRLREASRIGAFGLKEAIRYAKPGMVEYQIAALAKFLFVWQGASGEAFSAIAGSGPNSCIIHYDQNDRKMASGDVVLLDFGADFRYYESDITRTFPVSGKFSKEQAAVYQVVLDAQKAAIEAVRPGATFDMLERAAHRVLQQAGYGKPMPHSIGHYIGMSTHDVGKPAPFQAGVALAVEPGVYLPDKNMGIRIEDTVLVTQNGCEILSDGVPKEIADIEKLMAGEKRLRDLLETIPGSRR